MSRKPALAAVAAVLVLALLVACSTKEKEGNEGGASIPATQSAYVVVAWNDLGMHCLNPTYDTAVILPPYNTIWAQVIKRGNPPQIVTTGFTVEYRIVDNTTSSNKGSYGQFWQYAQQLFKVTLAIDKGLNLDDPAISNGLSGTMVMKSDHFQVNGIPVVPINDAGVKNPYQVAEITVKDSAGATVAVTRATVPTSDEINCGKCHGATTDPTIAFNDILAKHLTSHPTATLSTPVLCASCHGSPALGSMTPGSSGKFLSQAIHGWHATVTSPPACYDCHPGATTQCNRSISHTAADGNCTACHGTLSNVASTIASSARTPWVNEPKCATCHTGVADVDTGTALYRNSAGHGGVYCAGCHGSPHAMVPTSQSSDNYQAIQYQGAALSLGDCRTCHATSRGGGSNFAEEHASETTSACNVCHTGFTDAGNTAKWPHQFQWKTR